MCRVTAVLSAGPAAHQDLLCEGPRSLLAQAAVPGRPQDDGWGIARFDGRGKPLLARSPRPARLEPQRFEKAAALPSRLTLAHLRDASNPGKLPKAGLIGLKNTQPFAGEGLLFGHNGTLFIKEEIRSLLGKYAARVKGINDSEVLFWQVVKMLDAYGSPDKALEMALDEIRTVWVSCRGKYPKLNAPYRGLNMYLAEPGRLTVLCHWPGKKTTALLDRGWEYGRVAWRRDKDRVIFSSEPADGRRGWRKMNDPEVAVADARGGRLRLSFRRISL
ncbi:MAG: class II glutamine amidotransferase [Elusimicrobiales bacterium]|nr:class II glutamine amidotransferase [Elusimicrobiales bacterium]